MDPKYDHQVIKDTVLEVLFQLGLSSDDHEQIQELRKDFAYLRSWRLSMQAAQSKSVFVVISVVVSGLLAVLWLGIKSLF